jgi:hypothetical protein
MLNVRAAALEALMTKDEVFKFDVKSVLSVII